MWTWTRGLLLGITISGWFARPISSSVLDTLRYAFCLALIECENDTNAMVTDHPR